MLGKWHSTEAFFLCWAYHCAGLVLVNSAGKIVPGFMASDAAPASSNGKGAGPPAIVADLVSRALFLYLERSVAQCACAPSLTLPLPSSAATAAAVGFCIVASSPCACAGSQIPHKVSK